jgi:hypothetical protein
MHSTEPQVLHKLLHVCQALCFRHSVGCQAIQAGTGLLSDGVQVLDEAAQVTCAHTIAVRKGKKQSMACCLGQLSAV